MIFTSVCRNAISINADDLDYFILIMVLFELNLQGFSAAQGKTRINEMLKEIQLEDKRKARSCTLSGGMKRKLW